MTHFFHIITGLAVFGTTQAMQSKQNSVEDRSEDPASKCPWQSLFRDDICYARPRATAFTSFRDLHLPRPTILNITLLGDSVAKQLRFNPAVKLEFFEAWRQIESFQAMDVLATKETWTEYDTKMLQKLVRGAQFDTMKGLAPLTTEAIKARLPTLKDLIMAMNASLAIVGGSSSSVVELGTEIDAHTQVARFGNPPKMSRNSKAIGSKQTIHVVNAKEDGTEGIPIFDLDTASVLRSYCTRLFEGAEHKRKTDSFFMFTPTGFCKMPKAASSLSEPFLFYWLVGSLFQEVHMYNVLDTSEVATYNSGPVTEAEQVFYKEIAKQWEDSAPIEKNDGSMQPEPRFAVRS